MSSSRSPGRNQVTVTTAEWAERGTRLAVLFSEFGRAPRVGEKVTVLLPGGNSTTGTVVQLDFGDLGGVTDPTAYLLLV